VAGATSLCASDRRPRVVTLRRWPVRARRGLRAPLPRRRREELRSPLSLAAVVAEPRPSSMRLPSQSRAPRPAELRIELVPRDPDARVRRGGDEEEGRRSRGRRRWRGRGRRRAPHSSSALSSELSRPAPRAEGHPAPTPEGRAAIALR
jgi:hypothetical protein